MDSVAADRGGDCGGHGLGAGAAAVPVADGLDRGDPADSGHASSASGYAGGGVRNQPTATDAGRHAVASTDDQSLALTSSPPFGEGLGIN